METRVSAACCFLRHGAPVGFVSAMSFDQGEFNFDARGDDSGWRRWREELDAKKKAFETRWGVVMGKRVVVWLRDHAKPLRGTIECLDRDRPAGNAPPRFRVCGAEFGVDEIESIVREDDG